MKKSEFVKYRRLINQEIERRKYLEELYGEEKVKEYLKSAGLRPYKCDSSDTDDVIKIVLSNFNVTETNGIYVCTSAYFEDWRVCYEDTMIFNVRVKAGSPKAEFRLYRDIEDESQVLAVKGKSNEYPSFYDFEKSNIVLNPYDDIDDENGYDEVRNFFFKKCIDYSQATSKKLVLEKYPRL